LGWQQQFRRGLWNWLVAFNFPPMKQILIHFFIVSVFLSCSRGNPGRQHDIEVVLNVFKAWENNDMKVIKANFTDSVELYFPTGDVFNNSIDSFIKIANTYFVDSLNKKEIIFYRWISEHSVEKNEDWVRIWYKEIDSYKNGRIDSIELQDDNLMRNGKINKVYSHMRKLNP
jgi:hypothetical protein